MITPDSQPEPVPAVNVRTWTAPPPGASRNLFAVETPNGLVLVDGPLRRSDGTAARCWLDELDRPLLAVLLTHAHPDHYYGLTELLAGREVPIHATPAVAEAVRATAGAMRPIVSGYFGAGETEERPPFPNTLVSPGRPTVIDGVPFVVTDYGEAESPADSVWTSPALPGLVFSGDLLMHRTHLALHQGRSAAYMAAVERLGRETGPGAVFMAGHGGLITAAAIGPQLAYLNAYREAVRELAAGRPHLTDAARAELVTRMRAVEPSPVLAFLIAGGADAVAVELAAEAATPSRD